MRIIEQNFGVNELIQIKMSSVTLGVLEEENIDILRERLEEMSIPYFQGNRIVIDEMIDRKILIINKHGLISKIDTYEEN